MPKPRTATATPRRRCSVLLLTLAVSLGVFAAPPVAQASPYWRVSMGVTPAKASCLVAWTREYWDGPVATYKVWVVPQSIAPGASGTYRKITVTPQSPGMTKSVRVPSLIKGSPYVFWLEALYPSYFPGGLVSVQQGSSRGCIPT
jgi:hypothetical protein